MPPLAPSWRARAGRAVHHPRLGLALKAAAAAVIALFLAQRIPGAAHSYSFYAPLGAVVTMYPTAKQSVQETFRSLAAIAVGAGLALAADRWVGPNLVAVGLIVGLGVALGHLRVFGDKRGYVATAGLFTLVIGQGQETTYAGAYAGLFLLGGLVTLTLHAAFPTVPVREADVALGRLREALSAHLLHLGEQVSGDEERRGIEGSAPDRPDLGRLASGARAAVQEAQDSFRANHRARRYHEQVRGYAETFTALSRVGLLVDDLYALAQDEPWGQDVLQVDAELREPMGRALAELAAAVPHVGLQDTELGRRESVDAAVGDLYAALRDHEVRHGTDPQALVVAAIATTLRRTLSVLSPAEMRLSNPAEQAA